MSSLIGLMASSINNNAVQGETFLPGQIFVFSGFAPRANSLGQLELQVQQRHQLGEQVSVSKPADLG